MQPGMKRFKYSTGLLLTKVDNRTLQTTEKYPTVVTILTKE